MSDNKDQEYFDNKIDKLKKIYNLLPKIIKVFFGLSLYVLAVIFIFDVTSETIKNKEWFKLTAIFGAPIIASTYYFIVKKK